LPWPGFVAFLFPQLLISTTLPSVGIKDPLVPKTDTQEMEKLDKAISSDQKGASMCLLQLSKHTSTKWLTVAPPYIADRVVSAPHLGFVQVKCSQSLPIG
jgi:hypothetical protein